MKLVPYPILLMKQKTYFMQFVLYRLCGKLSCCPDICPRVSYGGAGDKYNNSDLTRILQKRGDNKSQSSIAGICHVPPIFLLLSNSCNFSPARVITLGFSSGLPKLFSLITSCIEWLQTYMQK